MTIDIPMWVDIWSDGTYEVHAPQSGREPAEPQNTLGGWKRYRVTVPVPLPVPPDGTAKISYEGIQRGNPKAGQ